MSAPVMILAGGTGGHVFPALAVAEALRRRAVPVVWMGTHMGLEARVVPAAGIELERIDVRGLRAKGWVNWLAAPLMLARALAQALRAMRARRPRSVLGMGGYAAGPGALAAWLLRRPLLIHEQNAIAGMTNRYLARLARGVLAGYTGALPQGLQPRVTGNPVRDAIRAIPPPAQRFAERGGPLRLLVLGGSLGARWLNEHLPAAVAAVPPACRPEVRHQAGERTHAVAVAAYRQAGFEARVEPFIEDMAEAYAWADLVVCRAGALTVAELAAAGVAALFIPFPHAVDDHQSANAAGLVSAGGAALLQERDLSIAVLSERLTALLDNRSALLAMAEKARTEGRPEAADRVAAACLEVARD